MFKFSFLILFISLSSILTAQSFTATVDKNKVSEDERFEARFTFEGKEIKGLKNFSAPSFKDFRVLSGPNQSTSMQIINGVSSSALTLSYILLPNTTGSFTIGSSSIEYNGTSLSTKPISITVTKGSSKPKDEKSSVVSESDIADNLFIRASIDKNKVYQGEQVTVTYKLYTRLNIAAQMSVDKLPQYQGFWAEELGTSQNISFTTEVLNGKQYKVGLLKRAALFATQTGMLEVTPFELTIPIQIPKKRNPNNVWDDFFGDPFGRAEIYEYKATSNIVSVDVVPLPEKNKPASFKGAVGNYVFFASIDKSTTKTNEPISLKIKITGTGNIKLLELPDFELPNGFEKYDPKINEQVDRGGRIGGIKEAEFLLIPRIAGSREILPIEFSFFDVEKKSYQTIISKSFSVNIKQGESNVDLANQQNIQQLDSDIRFIKTKHADVDKRSEILLLKPAFWVASIIPFLASIILIGWKRKQDKLSGNQQLLKYSKAEKVARNRFKKAKKFLEQNNVEFFYSEISQALFGYLEDKFRIPKSEFTLDKAADELTKRNISAELVEKMKINAQKCEFIRFAPSTNPAQAMNEMYNSFSAVVIDIERSITK